MAASTGTIVRQENDLFFSCVDHLFNNWTALKYAVQYGMGGSESAAKAQWLVDVVDKFFRENDNLYPDEVEYFIAAILNTEFHLVTEDGSLEVVSQQLCQFFRLYERNETEELQAFMKKTLGPKEMKMTPGNHLPHLENNLQQLNLNPMPHAETQELQPTRNGTYTNDEEMETTKTPDEDSEWKTVRKMWKK